MTVAGAGRGRGSREGALHRAATAFDAGAFEQRLSALVAIPSTSQEPAHADDLDRYLRDGVMPWLTSLGFQSDIHANPASGGGPILLAERIEQAELPTVITYGHGDTVAGLDDQWTEGRTRWTMRRDDERWYGRGTADNKGQHAINLFALEHVLAERHGRLGCNVKLVLETGEERGSIGLRDFVARHAGRLAADLFLASDGPRVAPDMPTIAAGTRGNYHFDLVVAPRQGGVHSGHWGGLTTDPALVLSHALASICDRNGKILVRDWLPFGGAPLSDIIRTMLADCPVDPGSTAARIEPHWGEPGPSAAEKLYAWNSFIVLATLSGRPEAPMNAVAPWARAHCQIRFTTTTNPAAIESVLRRHLDAHGFAEVRIEAGRIGMPASASSPDDPWIRWAADSMARSLGRKVQVIPAASGGMPGDVFQDLLGTPLVWVPHGHNGCQQHGPDEHMLVEVARQGISAFAGFWWDLGEGPFAGWSARRNPIKQDFATIRN